MEEKCDLQSKKYYNQTLPCGVPQVWSAPSVGTPERNIRYKNATGKGLQSLKYNDVP